jgi:ABC-type Mn2+/Zn2+ transport system permease subunit/Mn-dependent DtxR family transcriptional regulator
MVQRALLAACMAGMTCGLLGSFVVLRNMSLIGDALSHAVLPGVVLGFVIMGAASSGLFLGAVAAGLMAAVAITFIQRSSPTKPDAVIGIVFTAMFSLGVMGISWLSKSQGVHLDLKDYLFGSMFGANNEDLVLSAVILALTLGSIALFYRWLFATTIQPVVAQTMGMPVQAVHYFLMLLLSFAVVSALRTVGVILMVAMLVTPAATALLLTKRLQNAIVLSGLLGFAAAFLGFLLAVWLDTTPGPAMAVLAALGYVAAVLLAPDSGLLPKWWKRRKQQNRIDWEDAVKLSLRLENNGGLTAADLQTEGGYSPQQAQLLIKKLCQIGWLRAGENGRLSLTDEGRIKATRLVRAHRLWETYLVEKLGLSSDQIHEEAEKYEHLLPDELLEEIDRQLSYPQFDPHGSEIPREEGR